MTTRDELVGNLPLQYSDGPDYCTVKDATGGDFALTVQPELMKLMEDALASRQEVSVTVEAQRLADAMWQLLDDMGANGQSVCLGAKAEARVAYEPFRDTAVEYADWMSLADAERILKECGQ